MFELIAIHRKTHTAHMASLELQNRFERRYGIGEGSWISEKPCLNEDHAFAEPAARIVRNRSNALSGQNTLAQDAEVFLEVQQQVDERADAPA